MRTNLRVKSVRAKRKKTSDVRLIAFLPAARETSSGVQTVSFACSVLDEGKSLDKLFYDGHIYGYSLRVVPQGEGRCQIEFGCQAGPTAGDGGTWTMAFDGDEVTSIRGGLSYIS